jgi:hypothetical protein
MMELLELNWMNRLMIHFCLRGKKNASLGRYNSNSYAQGSHGRSYGVEILYRILPNFNQGRIMVCTHFHNEI